APPPRMAGSSTGYIDEAIVGSEIRFRFDADFDLQNPDRAEFFYAKCGCYRNEPNPADPNAPGPGPGVAKSVNLQELQLHLEYAPNRRISVFVETPVRFIQFTPVAGTGNLANGHGVGDVRAGFKYAVLAGENRYLTFQLRAYFPSGDALRGLGTNHYSVEPTLWYYQRLGERLAVSGEFGDWHPIGGSSSAGLPGVSSGGFAGDVLIYGLGAGYDVVKKEEYRVTPVLEFVGWSILSGLVTGGTVPSTSGVTIANVKIGARLSVGGHHSFYAGYGKELTPSSWYTDIVRFEYRFAF
ncbi:MAG: transporter, partial [Bryobacteraceae bacterium]